MNHYTSFVEYPVDMPSDIMIKFHKETVQAQRWDLARESRLLTFVCLN